MPDPSPKLPQKLDELSNLFNEIGLGWMLKAVVRLCINNLGFARLAEKLAEVADAAVDDYFTSKAAEWTIEGRFRSMAKDFVGKSVEELDRWAR